MSTARRRLKSPRSLSGTSAHPTMVTLVNITVMDGRLTPFSFMSIGRPTPGIRLFQALTLKFQGQGHGCGQRARSYTRARILLIHFLFISHQSEFLRYSYFEMWPLKIQGQGHDGGKRSRSHIIPSIQTIHFLFVSHQSEKNNPEIWPN